MHLFSLVISVDEEEIGNTGKSLLTEVTSVSKMTNLKRTLTS